MLMRWLVLAGVAPLVVVGHDMWIEPTNFFPQAGQVVGARLRVGQELIGDPIPRDPSLINQFVVDDGTGRKPLVGRVGADPAGLMRAAGPGVHVIGYYSNPSEAEQTAEKFLQYVKEEGLEAAVTGKKIEGPVRELFSRCAKSLVLVGAANATTPGDRVMGLPLELVAERNPFALTAGQDLPVRLTYEGKPLAGALVVAMNKLNPAEKLTARSGKDGRVRFAAGGKGMWMVKAVHMIPAPAGGGKAQWMSYWASLTFER